MGPSKQYIPKNLPLQMGRRRSGPCFSSSHQNFEVNSNFSIEESLSPMWVMESDSSHQTDSSWLKSLKLLNSHCKHFRHATPQKTSTRMRRFRAAANMKPKRVLRRRTNRRGTLTRRRGSSSVRSAAGGLNSGMNCIKIGLPGKLSSVGEKVFGK